jgi:hypothetical protein
MTIKTRKVDPRAEGGAGILIKESSIKAIEKCRDESSLEKSSTDKADKCPISWESMLHAEKVSNQIGEYEKVCKKLRKHEKVSNKLKKLEKVSIQVRKYNKLF